MRRAPVFAAILMLLLGAGLSGSRSQPGIRPLDLLQIADGIFVHRGTIGIMSRENEGSIANLGVVIGEDCVAVIDTGGNKREGERFLAAIRAVTSKPVCYVVNTHMHPDDVFGNGAFAAERGRLTRRRCECHSGRAREPKPMLTAGSFARGPTGA
jgi:glyoxylase-like metal-dependent hydrolase (beta-lactamase superfamily II)